MERRKFSPFSFADPSVLFSECMVGRLSLTELAYSFRAHAACVVCARCALCV